jgi:hypothetical protein
MMASFGHCTDTYTQKSKRNSALGLREKVMLKLIESSTSSLTIDELEDVALNFCKIKFGLWPTSK